MACRRLETAREVFEFTISGPEIGGFTAIDLGDLDPLEAEAIAAVLAGIRWSPHIREIDEVRTTLQSAKTPPVTAADGVGTATPPLPPKWRRPQHALKAIERGDAESLTPTQRDGPVDQLWLVARDLGVDGADPNENDEGATAPITALPAA
jgi:hypothetical protein